jgi:hypothetical protein
MAIEAELQQNEEHVHKDTIDSQTENPDLAHIAISVDAETAKPKTVEKPSGTQVSEFHFSDKLKKAGRLSIFFGVIAVLLIGRLSVPDNEVSCVQDKVMNALQGANDFINAPGNEGFRNFFQGFCSFLIDIIFIATFGYWVLRGTSGRLPISLGLFYITRALVQNLWFSPFPQGFYWESPGLPSLVVPYGRGSDFFFSGHSGFLVICAMEWHKLNFPKLRNFVIATLAYTALILLTYRIHYSIDIFVGIFFAEWCFGKVHTYKDTLDNWWIYGISKAKNFFIRKSVNSSENNCEATHLTA